MRGGYGKRVVVAPLLEVIDLRVHYPGEGPPVRAVDGVSFRLERGETSADLTPISFAAA